MQMSCRPLRQPVYWIVQSAVAHIGRQAENEFRSTEKWHERRNVSVFCFLICQVPEKGKEHEI